MGVSKPLSDGQPWRISTQVIKGSPQTSDKNDSREEDVRLLFQFGLTASNALVTSSFLFLVAMASNLLAPCY